MKTVEELEKEFSQLAQEIYQRGERRIYPTWPWVLIRAVPKEQQYGSLMLPDVEGPGKQHKPLLEGIVLATWKPHWSRFRKPGVPTDEQIFRESDFKPGDRVLYPHFAGLPVNFLDDKNYRLIREWTFDELGGAFGIVHYDGDYKLRVEVNEMFKGLQSVTMSGR